MRRSRDVPLRDRLRELMAEQHWSRQQVADHCGLAISTVQNLLGGRVRRAHAQTIGKLARGFNVAPEAITRPHEATLTASERAWLEAGQRLTAAQRQQLLRFLETITAATRQRPTEKKR